MVVLTEMMLVRDVYIMVVLTKIIKGWKMVKFGKKIFSQIKRMIINFMK